MCIVLIPTRGFRSFVIRLMQRMPAEHGGHANWEGAFKLFVVGSLFMSAMFYFRPASNPHDWARDEAEERNRRYDCM